MKLSCFKYQLLITLTPMICLFLSEVSIAHELCHVVQQGSFRVEISSAHGEEVIEKYRDNDFRSITIDDIVIPAIASGVENGHRTYEPGEALLGSIFVSICPNPDSNSYNFFKEWFESSQRQNIRKNISIVCLKRDGSEARRFNFFGAFPKEWTLPRSDDGKGDETEDRCVVLELSMDRCEIKTVDNGDCDDDDDTVAPEFQVLISTGDRSTGGGTDVDSAWETWSGGCPLMKISRFLSSSKTHEELPGDIIVDDLVLEGPLTSGRQELFRCLNAIVNGEDERCRITVQEHVKNMVTGLKDATMGNRQSIVRTYNYYDCFPTRYVFPEFTSSTSGDDSLLEERFSFKPERIEDA